MLHGKILIDTPSHVEALTSDWARALDQSEGCIEVVGNKACPSQIIVDAERLIGTIDALSKILHQVKQVGELKPSKNTPIDPVSCVETLKQNPTLEKRFRSILNMLNSSKQTMWRTSDLDDRVTRNPDVDVSRLKKLGLLEGAPRPKFWQLSELGVLTANLFKDEST
jgi:hypothetical protein